MSKKIIEEHGLRKLYTGFFSAFFRDSIAMATYFCTYEICKRKMLTDPDNVPIWTAILAGGISGVATWTATYPIDYIKTLIQTDSLTNPRQHSMYGYFKE